ncbi:CC0125/CC1285 family lipoprotein [Phenylobacterium sp.]|uniref:CC0125/CC1285 family lipoprotein n=1 Tax=Phenylobacterium sp. TaxID=1871053 RepID=UPI002DE9C436|nr:hypothetical protein [Phenylobacterium sp.]
MAKTSAAFAVALALTAGLAACATPTPYQPNIPGQASSGGYSELRIEPDRWRVTFNGNSLTSRETVEAYLLYRSAELSVQQGYDWFSIVDRHTNRDAHTYVQPDPLYQPWYGYGGWRPSWRFQRRGLGWRTWDPFWGDPFWADRYDVQTVERFEASAEIVMHHGAKPPGDPGAFDAHAVIDSLRPRIQYPAPPK